MRTLHLIDNHPDHAWPATYAHAADTIKAEPESEPTVTLIGGSREARIAESVGLNVDQRLDYPTGLTAWIAQKRIEKWGPPHAFDHTYVYGSTSTRMTRRPIPSVQQSSRAANEESFYLDLTRISEDRQATRAALRQSWDISPENDAAARVVAMLSDPPAGPHSASVDHAALALSMAADSIAIGNKNVRLAAPPTARHRLRAEKTARARGCPNRVIQAPELLRPWHGLLGCDVALCLPAYIPDSDSDPHHPRKTNEAGIYGKWARALDLPVINIEREDNTAPVIANRLLNMLKRLPA